MKPTQMGYMTLPPVRATFQLERAMPHFPKSGILALGIIEFQQARTYIYKLIGHPPLAH
jgi:hypothetical protein